MGISSCDRSEFDVNEQVLGRLFEVASAAGGARAASAAGTGVSRAAEAVETVASGISVASETARSESTRANIRSAALEALTEIGAEFREARTGLRDTALDALDVVRCDENP